MCRVWTGLNHWLCPYFQKSADSKMQGRGWPCDIWILSVWTVSWKLRLSCRHVTIKRNFDSFQTGYLEKALISQSFIYEPLRGPLHAYMNVTFKTERMSREVLDDCLTISLEQNYNLSQHIKEVKASQCHPLLMYKQTKTTTKKSVFHHLSQRPFSKPLSPLGQPCCFNSITPREP